MDSNQLTTEEIPIITRLYSNHRETQFPASSTNKGAPRFRLRKSRNVITDAWQEKNPVQTPLTIEIQNKPENSSASNKNCKDLNGKSANLTEIEKVLVDKWSKALSSEHSSPKPRTKQKLYDVVDAKAVPKNIPY